MYTNRICLLLLSLALLAGCKKEENKTTTCASTMYGYDAPYATTLDTSGARSLGTINPTTVSLSTLGTIHTSTYSNQAAFNTSDGNYYVFKTRMGSSGGYGGLYQMSSGGATNLLSAPPLTSYSALTYNRVNSKLYCIATVGSVTSLSEIIISGTSFSVSSVATPIHTFGGCTTVDDITGTVYYTSSDTSNFYVEKYTPGTSAPIVVASGTGAWSLLGLRFNKNDHMLYVIKESYAPPTGSGTFEFLKINPSAGSVTVLSTLPFNVNREFYSACVDPCENRYIVSTLLNTSGGFSSVVNQLNMSGAIVQHNVTTNFFQGLDVKY